MGSGKSLTNDLKKNLEKNPWSFRSITAIVLFGAIIMVFVFFGYNTENTAGGQGYAARVNDTFISLTDLTSETQRLEQFYSSLFGGQMPPGAQRQFMQNQALENLISSELMAQEAADEMILATDAELRDYIMNDIEAFREDGRFRRDRYEAIMQANNWTPGVFEARVRKDRQVQRVRRLLEAGLEPMTLELEKTQDLNKSQLNLQFVRMDQETHLKANPVSDAVVNERLAQAEFKKKVADDFQLNKADYSQDEQVRASHILIKTGPGGMDEKKALEKITEIRKKAVTGDFARFAKENSEDQGSKDQGGDLGFFSRGKMVPEFDRAAFQLPVGEVSQPVKSQFGYHLIRVMDKKAATEATLEKFETDIARRMIASEQFDAYVKSLDESLQKNDVAAVESKLGKAKWDETGFFGLGAAAVPKIGNPTVLDSLSEVLKGKSYLNKIVREGPVVYVVKYKDMKTDSSPAPVAELREGARQRSQEVLADWVEEAKKSARVDRNQNLQIR